MRTPKSKAANAASSTARASDSSIEDRFWHLADLREGPSNVLLRGRSRHPATRPPLPLLTRSGHGGRSEHCLDVVAYLLRGRATRAPTRVPRLHPSWAKS